MKRIVTINHYGATPDMPGPSKNYEMSKFFADQFNRKSEFWICGYSHYIGKMDESLSKFKFQSVKKMGNFSIVKIRSTPYRKSSILRQLNITIFDFIAALKILFSKNIDCIILTIPPVTIFSTIAAKMKKIKLIADVEDLWPLFLVDMGMNNKMVIRYMDYAANYLYTSADGIAAVSSGMLEYVKDRVESKPMWVSPLGVNVDNYFNIKEDLDLIKNKKWRNDFKIMYLGVHGKANDIASVLNTVKIFNDKYSNMLGDKNVSFIFIGDGEQKQDLIKHASRLNLSNVYFEDPVPNEMVPDYLIHSDVCLTNLMKIDSFKLVRPNKLFQYMALGKPIISGIWGEFQTIIEEVGAGIYVDFTNFDEASKQIYNLISNKRLLIEMGIKSKDYIEKHGNRTKIFSDFYKHIIEE